MRPSKRSIVYVSLMLLLITGCKNVIKEKKHGWTITADPVSTTLGFVTDELGHVIDQVQLHLKKGNELIPLSDWQITQEEGKLIIQTGEPQKTRWVFHIYEDAIDVDCTEPDAFMTGISPAGEKRIPARISSQDNGIIYSQMGFVSATNIYNLFDIPTDIMIRFTRDSKLTRNETDHTLMDVQVPVTEGNECTIVKDYYTDVIGLSHYQVTDFKPVYRPISERFKTAATGWDSWYCYYYIFNEEHLIAEIDALAEELKPYGLEYCMIDAGYTRGKEANWLEWNKEWYPHGGKWCFDLIREKGLKPGIWLNPHGASYPNPEMAESYPEEYFFRDSTGNLSPAAFAFNSRRDLEPAPTIMRLDFTNPEVYKKHLRPLFRTLVKEWGLTFLKDGGWGYWMDYYEANREYAHNPNLDSRIIMLDMETVIREEMGDDNYIIGCSMHEVGHGFGLFDGSRVGPDNYCKWGNEKQHTMLTYFNSLFAGNYLNGICWWTDPDDIMIRDPLTLDEAITIVSSVSLSGQQYLISDFIAEFSRKRLLSLIHSDFLNRSGWIGEFPDKVKALPDERLELYRKTMPSMPIKAMDLYPFKCDPVRLAKPAEYPRALNLKVGAASGRYDVIALYNWKNEREEKVLDLHNDLGLEEDTKYLVFDFWNQKLLGITSSRIKEEVPAHGTKALIIRMVSENPQLLATSRHLTAAYSIQRINWNAEAKSLEGTSETVPGVPYILYFFIPNNYEFDTTLIDAENVTYIINPDGVLEVGFIGKKEPVDWKILFKKILLTGRDHQSFQQVSKSSRP